MTAKALTLALAATTAAATFADVVEVKFTVKTENDQNKVANKVISGLYDSEKDQHVFWTVEKRLNEKGKAYNANVAYTGTYFGFTQANDAGTAYDTAGTFATKAKKYGQNAELIWGGEDSPANVLVAGAWGSANSKSGQTAGILDGKPATGTWSAKVNTKMSYDQLLAKYGLTQSETLSKDEIAGTIAAIESQLNGIKDALATLSGKDAAALLGDTIIENYTTAFKMRKSATNAMEQARIAYTKYADAAEMDDEDYQAIIDEKQAAYDAAVAALDAVSYTNSIVTAKNETAAIAVISNKINAIIRTIGTNEATLSQAKVNFQEALKGLASATNGTYTAMALAWTNMTDAAEAVEVKKAETSLKFADWWTTAEGQKIADEYKAYKAWQAYCADFEVTKAQVLEGLEETAENTADLYDAAKTKHEETVKTYETAKADGKVPTTILLEETIAADKKKLEGYEADVAYWAKAYDEIVTANYRKQIAADKTDASMAKTNANNALKAAESARKNQAKNLDDLLNALATAIDCKKADLQKNGKALPLDEIEAKVDAFIEDVQADVDTAEKIMADAEAIAETIGLTLPEIK